MSTSDEELGSASSEVNSDDTDNDINDELNLSSSGGGDTISNSS